MQYRTKALLHEAKLIVLKQRGSKKGYELNALYGKAKAMNEAGRYQIVQELIKQLKRRARK